MNGGIVKESTKIKIEQIIKINNYKPNVFARLNAKQKRIIGIIIPRFESSTTSKILPVIERFLRLNNYITLIINTDCDEETELESIQNLRQMNVDGIIILATASTKKYENFLINFNIPLVFIGQEIKNRPSIIYDDFKAGVEIGEYVGNKINKNIGCICIDEDDISVGINRKNGILKGLKNKNITDIQFIYSNFTFLDTYNIIKEVLLNKKFNILICSTDLQALAVYKVAHELNLKIPDDLSVTGFGGYELSQIITPNLTTIKFENESAGYLAAEIMIKLLNNETCHNLYTINFSFIEGKSVNKL